MSPGVIESLSRIVDDSIVVAGCSIGLKSRDETCERSQDWDGTWWWLEDVGLVDDAAGFYTQLLRLDG